MLFANRFRQYAQYSYFVCFITYLRLCFLLVKAAVKALSMLLTKKVDSRHEMTYVTLRCPTLRYKSKCPHMPTLWSPNHMRTSATSYTSTVHILSEVARYSHVWMRHIDKRGWIQILYFVVLNSFVQIFSRPDSSIHWGCCSEVATRCMVKITIMVTRQLPQVEDSCHRAILDMPHNLLELKDFKRHDSHFGCILCHRDTAGSCSTCNSFTEPP